MSRQEAKKILSGERLKELSIAIEYAKLVVDRANDIEVVFGSSGSSIELSRIYSARRSRMVSRGMDLPKGFDETLEAFETHSGDLKTCYIKAGNSNIYFWLNDRGVIVGCIVLKGEQGEEERKGEGGKGGEA